MTAEACREWRESLGAYVLDQLPADERAAVGAHVDGCAACRAEVDSLTPLVHLLALADPAQLREAPTPPAQLGERIAAEIDREQGRQRVRRRRRFSFGFAAAAATGAAALLLALVVFAPNGGRSNSQTVEFASLPHGVAIAATLQPRPFGTEIRMDVAGIRSGTLCQVFLRRADGSRRPAGSFRYRYGGENAAVLTSALDLSAVRAVGVRAGHRTFVAPLRHGVGAEASSNQPTDQEEYS
jgi:putative zinc finger protein